MHSAGAQRRGQQRTRINQRTVNKANIEQRRRERRSRGYPGLEHAHSRSISRLHILESECREMLALSAA